MTSQNEQDLEVEAYELFLPHIRELCSKNWYNLEPDDRLSEANHVFTWLINHFYILPGQLWVTYRKVLFPYMNALNRSTPSRFYPTCLSLEQPLNTSHGEGTWRLLDCFPGMPMDETKLFVNMFVNSLPPKEQSMLRERFQGASFASVARNHGQTLRQTRKQLEQLKEQYQFGQW